MRISDWSSDVCSSDLPGADAVTRPILILSWALALAITVLAVHRGASELVHRELETRSRVALALYVTALHGRLDMLGVVPAVLAGPPVAQARAEEARGGKEGVSTCRSRGSAYLINKRTQA